MIERHIRDVPDFPKPGIIFKDITPLLQRPDALQESIDLMAKASEPYDFDLVCGIESRGFLVAAPLALRLGLGFVMVRKQGRLPGPTVTYTYDLEYGTDTIEIQADAVRPGQRAVLLDDLLATGGTMNATVQLFRRSGAEVAAGACLIELAFLKGRSRLDIPITTLMSYQA